MRRIAMKDMRNRKGIALVVTIILLIILATIGFNVVFGESGIIARAQQASFKHRMAAYKEAVYLYDSWKISETLKTNVDWINAGDMLKDAIEQEIITDITKDDVTIDLTEILPEIAEEDKNSLFVYKGELCYVSDKNKKDNAQHVKWCEELGIKVIDYTGPTGIVIRDGSYEFVNGLYLCTPKLDEGFDESRTRYLEVANNGCLVPRNWIYNQPTDDWYDYSSSKWANIYIENDGSELYYVWIPRYCFKLDQNKQRSDVKFINVDI